MTPFLYIELHLVENMKLYCTDLADLLFAEKRFFEDCANYTFPSSELNVLDPSVNCNR